MKIEGKDKHFTYSAFAKVGIESIFKLQSELYSMMELHPFYCVVYVSPNTFLDLVRDKDAKSSIYFDPYYNSFAIDHTIILINDRLPYGSIKGVICNYNELKARCNGTFIEEEEEDNDNC